MLLGAALLGLLEAVEEPAGVRASKRLHPVRLPFLDGVAGDSSPCAQNLTNSRCISPCQRYSSFSPTYMKTHIFEIA